MPTIFIISNILYPKRTTRLFFGVIIIISFDKSTIQQMQLKLLIHKVGLYIFTISDEIRHYKIWKNLIWEKENLLNELSLNSLQKMDALLRYQ